MKTKLHWRDAKALHAQGLTDAEVAALHKCSEKYAGRVRSSIGLKSNNGTKRNGNAQTS